MKDVKVQAYGVTSDADESEYTCGGDISSCLTWTSTHWQRFPLLLDGRWS